MMDRRLFFVFLALATVSWHQAFAAPGDLLFKLTAPDGDRHSAFGESLAIVDGDIVVGERYRNPPMGTPGRAYLFDGTTGELNLTFNNPDPGPQDHFANALAGGNGTVYISASGLPNRVFGFDSSTGALLQTIHDPAGMNNPSFGTSLAYANDTLLVGDPSYSVSLETIGTGRVYLFSAATGRLERTIYNPDPNRGDVFGNGRPLAIFGDKLAVGAIGDSNADGRVWVFDRETGEVAFSIANPRPERDPPLFQSDWFSQTVAANDRIIAVGAELEDTLGVENAGIVYVFDSSTGALRHTLTSPQVEPFGDFGRSLALTPDGDILVGAWRTSVDGVQPAGQAYLFDDLTGELLLHLTSPQPLPGGQFGWSVAAMEGALVVGAPNDGAVYVFPEPSSLVLAGSLVVTSIAISHTRWLTNESPRAGRVP
jgi:outer membrane protein assembly factor BamB